MTAVQQYCVPPKRHMNSRQKLAYILLAPAVLYLLFSMVVPLGWSVVMSFTDKKVGTTANFIGFDNYTKLLTSSTFWPIVKNTLVFTLGSVVVKVIIGVFAAAILNTKLPGKGIWRACILIPWTIPNVISTLTWKWIFSDAGGILNFVLKQIGIIRIPIAWTADPFYAMIAVIIVNVWKGMPFMAISVLAGMQTIDENLYEAAHLDGANNWQCFVNVTLPSVKDIILLTTLVTTIWTLNNFESIWLMTGGGPYNATQVLGTYAYTVAFQENSISRALAVSVLSCPFVFSLVYLITKKTLK